MSNAGKRNLYKMLQDEISIKEYRIKNQRQNKLEEERKLIEMSLIKDKEKESQEQIDEIIRKERRLQCLDFRNEEGMIEPELRFKQSLISSLPKQTLSFRNNNYSMDNVGQRKFNYYTPVSNNALNEGRYENNSNNNNNNHIIYNRLPQLKKYPQPQSFRYNNINSQFQNYNTPRRTPYSFPSSHSAINIHHNNTGRSDIGIKVHGLDNVNIINYKKRYIIKHDSFKRTNDVDLGKSVLNRNIILNPSNNMAYNKYILEIQKPKYNTHCRNGNISYGNEQNLLSQESSKRSLFQKRIDPDRFYHHSTSSVVNPYNPTNVDSDYFVV